MKYLISVVLFFYIIYPEKGFCSDSSRVSDKINFYIAPGVFVKGPMLGDIRVNKPVPIDEDRLTKGPGVSLNLITYFNKLNFGIDCGINIRYGEFIYKAYNPDNWHILTDLSISLKKFYINEKDRYWYIGTGYTINNIGKELKYDIFNDREEYLSMNIEYSSFHVLVGFPLWRFHLETQLHYTYRDFEYNPRNSFGFLLFKLVYPINIK